jgi:hypothetical protein
MFRFVRERDLASLRQLLIRNNIDINNKDNNVSKNK